MKTRSVCLALLFAFIVAAAPALAEEPETVTKAIVIQVVPGTIALPGGDAARMPVSAARFRSSELRDLNEDYNAVAIEKLYQVYDPSGPRPGSGSKRALRSKDPKEKNGGGTLDMAKVLRKKMRKKVRKEGQEVVEQPDVYLIEFELSLDTEIKDVVVTYWMLDVVTFAQEVSVNEE